MNSSCNQTCPGLLWQHESSLLLMLHCSLMLLPCSSLMHFVCAAAGFLTTLWLFLFHILCNVLRCPLPVEWTGIGWHNLIAEKHWAAHASCTCTWICTCSIHWCFDWSGTWLCTWICVNTTIKLYAPHPHQHVIKVQCWFGVWACPAFLDSLDMHLHMCQAKYKSSIWSSIWDSLGYDYLDTLDVTLHLLLLLEFRKSGESFDCSANKSALGVSESSDDFACISIASMRGRKTAKWSPFIV